MAPGFNRVHDVTADTTVLLKDRCVTGDVLTLSYRTFSLVNKNGGKETVNMASLSLTGRTDFRNYTLSKTTTTIFKLVIKYSVLAG